jgi:hypothetical protein
MEEHLMKRYRLWTFCLAGLLLCLPYTIFAADPSFSIYSA